jgi:hypothetical protein
VAPPAMPKGLLLAAPNRSVLWAFWGQRHHEGDKNLFRWETSGRRHKGPLLAFTIVTWLILPVVICLSQRLSHASLSLST